MKNEPTKSALLAGIAAGLGLRSVADYIVRHEESTPAPTTASPVPDVPFASAAPSPGTPDTPTKSEAQ